MSLTITESRKCLECEEIIFGRADKKFCSDACRTSFNNKLNSVSENYVRRINSALRKNRSILKTFCPTGKNKVSREHLTRNGFDFSLLTTFYETKSGDVYKFCYEYGYLDIGNEQYLIVKKDN